MRKFCLQVTLALTLWTATIQAQDLSNKGRDFWIPYPEHIDGTSSAMGIYITSDVNTSGTINVGAASIPFTVTANTITRKFLGPNAGGDAPNTAVYMGGTQDGIGIGKGIHVTSLKDVVVFAHIIRSARSGATLVLPTKVWGKEYIAPSFGNTGTSQSYGQLNILASKPNTQVEITPIFPTRNGVRAAGVPYTITLANPGDVYQIQWGGSVDLSGTKIRSVASGGTSCNPIAVFSSTTWTGMPCTNASGGDNLLQQLFPTGAWGKQFLTGPLKKVATNTNDFNIDYVRVYVKDPATVVRRTENGIQTTLTGLVTPQNYYQYTTYRPTFIEADQPVQVVQYVTSQTCGSPQTNSDPEMVVLGSVEQTINNITVFSAHQNFVPPGQSQVTTHYLNVIMKTNNTSSFRINGNLPSAPFTPIPATLYSYLKEDLTSQAVSNPVFNLTADSGFSAIAYGFGNVESYGYNAGTNVKDLYQQILVNTQFGIEPTPAVCKGSPFKFKVSLPYCADSIRWDLSSLPGPPLPTNPLVIYTNCNGGTPGGPDSVRTVNGKQIYWYSLPTTFNFNTSGTFAVTILTYNSTANDGCGSEQEINFDLNVYDPPVADFSFTTPGCLAEPVVFTDITTTPRPSYIWNWNFGDPGSGTANTATTQNPTHTFSAPGSYTVTFSTITTPGCISAQITKTVVVPSNPTATITTSAVNACIGTTPEPIITFSGSGGALPYTFTYQVNTGPLQTISTTGTNTSVTLTVPTTATGTFRYYLRKVTNNGSTTCFQDYPNTYVDVNITSNASLTLSSATPTANQTICVNTPITNIVYTIGGATGVIVSGLPTGVSFVYNAPTLTISGTPSGGPNNYLFTVSTVGGCATTSLPGSILVTASTALALSSAAGTDAQQICRSSALTDIIYAISGPNSSASLTGPLPAGVTWNFNSGVLTITGTPTVAGTFPYTITATGTCGTTTTQGTIFVHLLPSAGFNLSSPICETKNVTFSDLSVPNSGAITTWNWNFGDATTSSLQNPVHAYSNAGTYTVTLSVTTDKGCTSNPVSSQTLQVSVNPKAGFMVPEACLNDVAVFTDTSTTSAPATITGWQWNFGDPASGALNTSTTQHGSHAFSATGSYLVTHIVFSSTGCPDTVQHTIFINGANPVSDFTILNPAGLCANDSVSISNQSTVNPGNVTRLEIYWDNVGAPGVFDIDNSPTTGKIYKHLYPNFQTPLTRTFDVRVRAFSGTICLNDRIRRITVNAAPKVQFNAVPAACLDATPFQVTQATEIGGVPGTGIFSGPGITPGGIFNPSLVGPGTYTIKYTFTSSAGGCIDTLSKTIIVLDSASARFTYSAQVCDRSPVSFNSSTSTIPAAAGTITGWNWNFGDPASGAANTSTLQNPTHLFTGWGTYNVTLSVTTSNNCRSTVRTIPVYVNPIPRSNFSFPASACLPSATISFSNSATIADGTQSSFSYLWNFGDPGSGPLNTSTGSSPSHIYTSIGPFNVNLQVTSGAGCVHDTTIIVNNIHPEPTGLFNVNPIDVCVGQSMTFTDASNPADGTTTQWNWDMADGNTRNTPTFNYTYASAGTFDVKLFITNNFGCKSTTFTRTVTANPYPTINAGPDLFILEGGSDTLQPIVTAINPTFIWTPNTYFLSSNTIQNPIVKGVADITYTVTVTGRGGCVSSDQVFIKVLKGPEIPNIFSPNGDGVHDTWVIKYLDTYPQSSIEVFNRYGQRIFSSVGYGNPWDGKVNGKTVPMGTYYYIVNPKNGRQIMTGYVDIIR